MNASQRRRWLLAGIGAILVAFVAMLAVQWSGTGTLTSAPASTTTKPTPTTSPTSVEPLKAPPTTASQDAEYLSEVTEADPALASYERRYGNVALRSLLTDGSAFCAFLNRSDNVDTAMVSVAIGARQLQSQTHLPSSVTAFNAIDSVALLALCPSLESVVPASDLAKVRKLGTELSSPAK